jgi:hypothetical protein
MEFHIPRRLVLTTPIALKIHPFSSCDYTQVANICPFLILEGILTLIMDKLNVKVKNMYLQAHACIFTIGLFAYVLHQHIKNRITIMARVKKRKNPIH